MAPRQLWQEATARQLYHESPFVGECQNHQVKSYGGEVEYSPVRDTQNASL